MQGDCWLISIVTTLVYSDLPLRHIFVSELLDVMHEYNKARVEEGVCPKIPGRWLAPYKAYETGYSPVVFLQACLRYSGYELSDDLWRLTLNQPDAFVSGLKKMEQEDETKHEQIKEGRRQLFLGRIVEMKMDLKQATELRPALLDYVRCGWLLAVTAGAIEGTHASHSLAIIKCKGKLYYCNSWFEEGDASQCGPLDKLLNPVTRKTTTLHDYTAFRVYLYFSAIPPRTVNQQKALNNTYTYYMEYGR